MVPGQVDYSLQMYPGLRIKGAVGSNVEIQYKDGIAGTWQSLSVVTLPSSSYDFVDDQPTSQVGERYYRVVVVSENSPDMVYITPGTFFMGSPDHEAGRSMNEGPLTEVELTYGYFIAMHEVTQAQYLSVMPEGTVNPSYFTGDLDRPVEQVSWESARIYCERLTEQERLAGRLREGWVYRLPTEAEWERACRAGTQTRFSFGDDPTYSEVGNYAWYGTNASGTTHPVGTKLALSNGLFDMQGNVAEWTLDYFGSYPGGHVINPRGPTDGFTRVWRGQSYVTSDPKLLRCANRSSYTPTATNRMLGFRVVYAPN